MLAGYACTVHGCPEVGAPSTVRVTVGVEVVVGAADA